jgi:hypothetical protein
VPVQSELPNGCPTALAPSTEVTLQPHHHLLAIAELMNPWRDPGGQERPFLGREGCPIGHCLPQALQPGATAHWGFDRLGFPVGHRLVWLLLQCSGMIRATADLLRC